MSIAQQIVTPDQIEPELLRIWSNLAKSDKTRACLFNLIVFNRLSDRTDYIRSIIQRIVDKFPCRILFTTHDPDPSTTYLKTAVSVVASDQDGATACDQIDIGVAGTDWQRVPYVILPHIVPDLPVYLLWTEDLSVDHPLFNSLAKLATRIIFDSESTDRLSDFLSKLLTVKDIGLRDIADLNWARLESWRELLASTFEASERTSDLYDIRLLHITFNARKTEFFCHLKIQALYLAFWLASRLGWKFVQAKNETNALIFFFESGIEVRIDSGILENSGPGSIVATEFTTKDGSTYRFTRDQDFSHHVLVQISTPSHCDLPYRFFLEKTARGQSLVREVFHKKTSPFFLETLRYMKAMKLADLC